MLFSVDRTFLSLLFCLCYSKAFLGGEGATVLSTHYIHKALKTYAILFK